MVVCVHRRRARTVDLAGSTASAAVVPAPTTTRLVRHREDPVVRDSVPRRWIDAFLPEQMPKLDYPGYATPLDRARMESFAGRYKRSLMTLLTVPADADPIEVALIRARSLAATGQNKPRWKR
jgi:hypothetical protein